jgi:hypothetical protein
MKYRVSQIPNTGRALNFKVRDPEGKKQSIFNFSHSIIETWGNPKEEKLKEVMIAYIKRHGWVKEPVAISADTPKNITRYIASLSETKKSKEK